jgi:hypothetical protein
MLYKSDEHVDQQLIVLREINEARQLTAMHRMHVANKVPAPPTINLLIKTKLFPWESLESLLFRVSTLNHLSGISILQRALMLPENGVMSIRRHLQLGVALGQDLRAVSSTIPTLMSKSTIRLQGHLLPIKHLALSSCRVCPHCVEELGYGKSYWALAPFSVCEMHKCMLIDSCAACEKPLTATRPAYDRCSCGARYSKMSSTESSEALHEMSRIIAAKFTRQHITNDRHLYPDEFLSMELLDVLELLTFLAALSEDPSTTYLDLNRKIVSLKLCHRRYKKASSALLDWPHGFHRLLAFTRSFRSYNETAATVYNSISHVIGAIPAGTQRKWCRFILSGVESFLSNRESWSHSSY